MDNSTWKDTQYNQSLGKYKIKLQWDIKVAKIFLNTIPSASEDAEELELS